MLTLENTNVNEFSTKKKSIKQMEANKLRKIRKLLLEAAEKDIASNKQFK